MLYGLISLVALIFSIYLSIKRLLRPSTCNIGRKETVVAGILWLVAGLIGLFSGYLLGSMIMLVLGFLYLITL